MTGKYFHFIIIHKSLEKNEFSKSFWRYYREIINTLFSFQTSISSRTLYKFLWFNSQIQIGNKIVIVSSFSEQNINFVGQLFKTSTSRRVWSSKQRKV